MTLMSEMLSRWALRSLLVSIVLLVLAAVILSQEFKYKARATTVCKTAPEHKHDDIVTVTMTVTSWDGCEMRGTIKGGKYNGGQYTLFGGLGSHQAKLNPKQKIKVTYDRSCGQVMFAVFPKDPWVK